MKRLIWLPLCLFLILAITLGFVLHSSKDKNRALTLLQQPMPSFQTTDFNGSVISNEDLKGKITLINFFASWCLPCRAEHTILLTLKDKNTHILGLNYKDKQDNAERYLKELGNPYVAVASDSDGRVAESFNLTGVPESFVIDRNATIRAHITGPLTQEIAEKELLPLIRILNNEQ